MTDSEHTGLLAATHSWTEQLVEASSPMLPLLPPRTSSPINMERTALDDSQGFDVIDLGVMMGGSLLWSAHEQLSGIVRLMEHPYLLSAIAACSRACLEASARAWWLFDRQISRSERVERVLNEGLFSANEFYKLMEGSGSTLAHPFHDEMVVAAEREGFSVLTAGDGARPRGVGKGRQSTTKVVDAMWESTGVFAWRVGSAATHATVFASIGALAGTMFDEQVNEFFAAMFVTSALGAFGLGVDERNWACGYPDPNWGELANTAQEDLAARFREL